MSTFPKKTLLASVGMAALMAIAPAHAYVMASSVINMTGFEILNSGGTILSAAGANTATPTGDFATLTFTSSADQSAALTGFATLNNSGNVAPINFAPICLGAGCAGFTTDNAFPHPTAPPASGNYSAADQNEAGSPVSNLSGFTPPATVADAAYAGLDTGSADASSTSNNNLNSSFTFVLTQSGGITLDFNVDAYLQVAMTSAELFPGVATASYSVQFSITNLDDTNPLTRTVFTWNPDIFGQGLTTLSLNAPLLTPDQNLFVNEVAGAFSNTTPTLNAGTHYQLSARITTLADATRQVPEPGALSLLGIALMGLAGTGFWRRRA